MNARTFVIGLGVCVLLAAGSAVRADKTDFKVNTDGGPAEQNYPRIAVWGDRRFVIVWVDHRDGTPDIFMQRYDGDANPVGGNVRVNDNPTASFQHQPAVASDVLGFYGVVWTDYRNGTYPFDPDVFYQRYDPFGAPSGGNVEITTGWPDTTKAQPDISLSAWGTGIVVWADRRNGNWVIYGQLIASSGALIGGNFKINDDAGTAQQHAPRVSASAEGWFVVTWYDNRAGHDDVYVQRFDSLGMPLGANYKVNRDNTTTRQAYPDVATDGAGHFTVVWVDWRNGVYPGNPDIYAARLDTNMNPVTPNTRINTDQSDRAQREVAISADRMGNVAIVWSDSGAAGWDIRGQMIDVDGVVREANFAANSFTDSAQLRADVALDGSYRYITWVDRRNGDYDIYASVTKYNDPALDIQPRLLQFTMQRGGELPPAQPVVIQDIGYNRLYYQVVSYNSWLSFDPAGGMTPDTVMVSIANNNLNYGSYFGALLVSDTVNTDSTYLVSVRLDVTAPVLVVQPDTLHFAASLGFDQSQTKSFSVTNGAAGSLTFSVQETADWISLSSGVGTAPSAVDVTVTTAGLGAGDHWAGIVVAAPEALGSPDTVWVHVEVVNDVPVIGIEPDSVHLVATNLSQQTAAITVVNLGAGLLSWTAASDAAWLNLGRTTGTDNDQIVLSVDHSLLDEGMNVAVITVTDSGAFNVSHTAVVSCEYSVIALDTLIISGAALETGEPWILPIELRLHHHAARIVTPILYDPALLTVDSVYPSFVLPYFMNRSVQHDPFRGQITLDVECLTPDTFLAAGVYVLGYVFFTAGEADGYCTIDTFCGAYCAQIDFASGGSQTPVVMPGLVQVGSPTFVSDTIRIAGTQAEAGQVVNLPVDLVAVNEIKEMLVPLEYDPGMLTCDSVVFDDGWPLYMSREYQIDSIAGTVQFATESLADNLYLSPGYFTPVTLWLTVSDFAGVAGVAARSEEGIAPAVVIASGYEVAPIVQPGFVQSGAMPADTIRIDVAVATAMSAVAVPVHIMLASDATRVVLPIRFDPGMLTADSIVFGTSFTDAGQVVYTIDSIVGSVTAEVSVPTAGGWFAAGEYLLADVFFTTGSQVGEVAVDTVATDSITALVEGVYGNHRHPEVTPGSVIVTEATSVEDGPRLLPTDLALEQNYPNPFNPVTTIAFVLPRRAETQLVVHNILGQVTATLVNQVLVAGEHEVLWNGLTDAGQPAPTGVYFYRLTTPERSLVRKMLLLK
jgi:hypothetical protein